MKREELTVRLLWRLHELSGGERRPLSLTRVAGSFPESTWEDVRGAADHLMARGLVALAPRMGFTEVTLTRAGMSRARELAPPPPRAHDPGLPGQDGDAGR